MSEKYESGDRRQTRSGRQEFTEPAEKRMARNRAADNQQQRFQHDEKRWTNDRGHQVIDKTTSGRLVLTEHARRNPGVYSNDQAARQSVSRGTGDDAGHKVGLQFGADASDVRNISRQNFIQNQGGGTWHDMENRWAKELRTRPHIQMHVSVTDRHIADKYGKERPMGRIVEVRRVRPNGKETVEKLHFVNPTTPNVRDIQENGKTGRPFFEARRADRDAVSNRYSSARGLSESNVVNLNEHRANRRTGPRWWK